MPHMKLIMTLGDLTVCEFDSNMCVVVRPQRERCTRGAIELMVSSATVTHMALLTLRLSHPTAILAPRPPCSHPTLRGSPCPRAT